MVEVIVEISLKPFVRASMASSGVSPFVMRRARRISVLPHDSLSVNGGADVGAASPGSPIGLRGVFFVITANAEADARGSRGASYKEVSAVGWGANSCRRSDRLSPYDGRLVRRKIGSHRYTHLNSPSRKPFFSGAHELDDAVY